MIKIISEISVFEKKTGEHVRALRLPEDIPLQCIPSAFIRQIGTVA